jgi:hypothetical protein
MKDDDVGELWRLARKYPNQPTMCSIMDLIRKLVEERARVIYISPAEDGYHERQMSLDRALSDFRIDPATWSQ